jgi:hypothetical protein
MSANIDNNKIIWKRFQIIKINLRCMSIILITRKENVGYAFIKGDLKSLSRKAERVSNKKQIDALKDMFYNCLS